MTRILPFLAILLVGCGLVARPNTNTSPSPTPEDQYPDPGWQVGPFSLTERSGKAVTDKDLHGSVWVASFVFTRCNGPCPAVSSTVARLQSEFKGEPGVKFVTFTVDPARDDLASLREYANIRGADPERWLFLTGDEETVHKLLREQFKQGVQRKTGAEVEPGDEYSHGTRLLVVDQKGVIRGIYDGLRNDKLPDADARFETDLVHLKDRVRKLLR